MDIAHLVPANGAMTARPVPASAWLRILRAPLLHFLLIGGGLFMVVQLSRPPERDLFVRLSHAEVRLHEETFALQSGRPPDESERRALIQSEVDDRLLLEEAFALGWHESDGVARRRLIQNQRFLAPEDPASDDELLERARSQGMDRSDIVVRRRLLERMRLGIAAVARETEPTREELESHRREHADVFMRPERVRLSHVFLSRDRRGASLSEDAETLGRRITADEIAPERAAEHSDPSLVRTALPLSSGSALTRELGSAFAQAALRTAVGQWSGPIGSAYGVHFVYVHEHVPATLPQLDEILSDVRTDWLHGREQRALMDHIVALRERAVVTVEPPSRSSPDGDDVSRESRATHSSRSASTGSSRAP